MKQKPMQKGLIQKEKRGIVNRFSTKISLLLLLATSPLVAQKSEQQPETWLTVFVHGIMSVKPHLTPSNFIHFMTDTVEDSTYSETVRLMREDPFFQANQLMQGFDLQKINLADSLKGNSAAALASIINTVSDFSAKNPLDNHYYTYGWSALLSPSRRYQDAQTLYEQLAQEVAKFKERDITPKIRLVSFSHGGNVCLYLAEIRQQKNLPELSIDELFMLGLPNQNETDYMVSAPIFKKIYNIYSCGDRIQKLDFFSFRRFFSRRLFKPRKNFQLPEKLVQIQIKCTREIPNKMNKDRTTFAYNFKSPAIISGKSHWLRDSSPGHMELWFLGWTPTYFRKTFPLYPLPIVAFVPIIIQAARDFEEFHFFKKPTLIDIRPEHEIMVVKNQKSNQAVTIARFLPKEQLNELSKIAERVATNVSSEEYKQVIDKTYHQAKINHIKLLLKKYPNKKRRPRLRRYLKKHDEYQLEA